MFGGVEVDIYIKPIKLSKYCTYVRYERFILNTHKLEGFGLKRVISLALSWLFLGCSYSQAELNTENDIPKELVMGIKHYAYSSSTIGKTPAELSMDYTHVKLPLGKFEAWDHLMIPSISLEQTEFAVNNGLNVAGNPSLYTIKSKFMFIKKLDDQWTRIVQVTPSLHTDGDVVDEEGFSLMGLAIWKYKSSIDTSWVMGIGANRVFGEYLPIPLVSYQYRVNDHSQIYVGFPVTKYENRFMKNWTAFSALKPVGGNWRFKTSANNDVNVSYTSWIASAGVRYQFKPRFWATIEIGKSLGREFAIDTDDESGTADVDDGTVLMLSVGMHP